METGRKSAMVVLKMTAIFVVGILVLYHAAYA